jgi:16S rRNA (uracil1498-N3)-methyltransferase
LRAEAAPSFLYVPELPGPGEPVSLPAAESHYLLRVVRARSGDACTATDGRGVVATLALDVSARRVGAVVERREERAAGPAATLLCGAPEGERADWLVEKLAELGIATWQPVDCARSAWRRRGLARWSRLAIAALRQSRSAFRMEVREPLPLARAVAGLSGGEQRWLADPGGAPYARSPGSPASEVVVVGPAGGLTDAETRDLRDLGFAPIRLAGNRLRTETAAVAWAAQWAGGSDPARAIPRS